VSILAVLGGIERGMVALGRAPDRDFLEAVEKVEAVFPGAAGRGPKFSESAGTHSERRHPPATGLWSGL
jgi:hypothetical protein